MYQFRDKKKYQRRNNFLRIIIIAGVVLLLFILGIISWSGGFFHRVGLPFWKTEKVITDKLAISREVTRTKVSVFIENESLKNKIAEQEARMADYQLIKDENDQLKSLLGRLPTKNNFILGTVLVKPNRSPYDTIIIDIGSSVGLVEGEQVFVSGEIPIGEIVKVYENTSLVMLYSNPDQKTEAIISGSNATVELIGRGAGNFEMIVPLDLATEKGTNVVLPSLNSKIIAVIESVLSNQTDSVKKVLLRSPVNIFQLKWVEVKTN
jgi:rod shape-determining protein MreC